MMDWESVQVIVPAFARAQRVKKVDGWMIHAQIRDNTGHVNTSETTEANNAENLLCECVTRQGMHSTHSSGPKDINNVKKHTI